jgi:type II restriction enzyme
MVKREFLFWFSKFRSSICGYLYYVDFNKVHQNVNSIKVELNILNSLIASRDIENDFEKLIEK